MLARIVARLLSLLRRRGVITSEGFDSSELPADAQLTFEAMRLPSSSPHGAALHSHNASVLAGFSLHCHSRASAHDHAARLRLFRYILRPASATNKLAFDGYRVTFEMKRALHDGRRALHFTPQAFVRRIALLVPRPRSHEVVYCGLFASNAKDRQKIVRVATHRRRSIKNPRDMHPPAPTLPWAELLRRTFDCDVRKCERCGGRTRIIAAITERPVIDKILACLNHASHAATASARAPPSSFGCFASTSPV